MDNRLALMCGTDIPIPECQLVAHQPRVNEIALIGETEFFIGLQTISVNKNMITSGESDLLDITNFQIFMTIMNEKETADKKQAVLSLFQLVFPQYKVIFTPRSIIFNFEGGSSMIDEENFNFLQECVKTIFCVNNNSMDQTTFNPANAQAKAIAEKLMRGRQRVAAQNGEDQGSIFSRYISTLAIGLQISVRECCEFTVFQIYDLLERYSLYINWDIDIRTRLAGGSPEDKPDNWMKNIH